MYTVFDASVKRMLNWCTFAIRLTYTFGRMVKRGVNLAEGEQTCNGMIYDA